MIHFIVSFIFLFFISGCAPATTHYARVEQSLAAHDTMAADTAIEKGEASYGKNSRLLYLMDRGMTLSLAGHYEKSNEMLDHAATTADALYTESLTRHVASLLTNDNILPYAGEDFERVMIHLIAALNYAQLGQISEALVECRRVDTKLNTINDQYQDLKNAYREDAFARYLSGMLYEAQGGSEGINNAFIAYRKGYEIYRDWETTYGTPIPAMIGADLLRTTHALGFREEHEMYQKVFPHAKWMKIQDQQSQGEIIIVSMNGRSPRKEDVFFDIVIDKNILNAIIKTAIWQSHVGSGNLPFSTLGQMVRIAFPKYVSQKSEVEQLVINLSGTRSFSGESILVEDITAIAQRNLSDRIVRIRMRAIARAAVKALAVKRASEKAEQAVGGLGGLLLGKAAEAAATISEVSDKRSWRTLPDQIHLTRMVVPPGTYQVAGSFVNRHGGNSTGAITPMEVQLKAGEKRFIIMRVL
jgi:hypothetical protein